MISELAGFTVSRVIPDKYLIGVMTGAYKICGGVIRDNSGQIVAHLINGINPLNLLAPVNIAFETVNTYQLHKLGKDMMELKESVAALQAATSKILGLAKGTMLLSGLTFAVSAASFVFLYKKLGKIDEKLTVLAKDVKTIRDFLKSREKAALTTALKTLSGIVPSLDDKTRIPLLVNARQTLGEIHERYRDQLLSVSLVDEVLPIEEYYSITALGHAMCSAELDMLNNAVSDLEDAYETWLTASRRVSTDLILRDDPERFLFSVYAKHARTDEIIDWMDFSKGADKGIEWIDELRSNMSPVRFPQIKLSKRDAIEMEVIRKFSARNRIYDGYTSQYRYLKSINRRPSELQAYFDSLSADDRVEDCNLLIADAALN
jgi:hypothetical protein